MGAVTGSLQRIVTGSALPELGKSVSGYANAFIFIEGAPWRAGFLAWALLASGAIVAIRYRRDPTLLTITLLPQVAAVIGYALFLDDLDHYYYLSLMPASVLTMLLAARRCPRDRLARAVGIALFVGSLVASCRHACASRPRCTGCRSTASWWKRRARSRAWDNRCGRS